MRSSSPPPGRSPDYVAAQTQAERDREILRTYVTGWIENGHTPSPKQLARLVCDAPAKQTLTDDEWWNVALLVSQELTHGG